MAGLKTPRAPVDECPAFHPRATFRAAAVAVVAGVATGILLGVGVVAVGLEPGEEGAAVEEEGGESSTLW